MALRQAARAPRPTGAPRTRSTEAALFRDGDGEVYAVGNRDPFSGADVIADGIMGSRDGVPVVASPMHKQEFDLRTGACLDDPEVSLPVLPVPPALR
ncbi:nitrite reductase (NAD(P)H) small subunit [Streptomyces gardneri]|uniref:nitrite reductase (NAD(P)H) small subunit n=1 Tax=Streptomyces gardneri TaxID=66892 RepID=UPI0034118EEF